jgi:hypothetical protein
LGSFPQVPLLVFVVRIGVLVVVKIMKYFFVRSQISHFALNRDDSSIRIEMANDTKTLKIFIAARLLKSRHLLFKNIHGIALL